MDISPRDTALVLTDPQNDFLSPDGATWELVGASVAENGTVDHIEQGFEVTVISDATAAADHPELGDGYAPALTNFRYLASAVLETHEAVAEMQSAGVGSAA